MNRAPAGRHITFPFSSPLGLGAGKASSSVSVAGLAALDVIGLVVDPRVLCENMRCSCKGPEAGLGIILDADIKLTGHQRLW